MSWHRMMWLSVQNVSWTLSPNLLVEKGRPDENLRPGESAIGIGGRWSLVVKEDGKSEYLLFLGQREISSIAAIIHEKWESINASEAVPTEGKKAGKAKKQAAQNADPELKKALDKVLMAARPWMLRCSGACWLTCRRKTRTPLVRLPTLSRPIPSSANSISTPPWMISSPKTPPAPT